MKMAQVSYLVQNIDKSRALFYFEKLQTLPIEILFRGVSIGESSFLQTPIVLKSARKFTNVLKEF